MRSRRSKRLTQNPANDRRVLMLALAALVSFLFVGFPVAGQWDEIAEVPIPSSNLDANKLHGLSVLVAAFGITGTQGVLWGDRGRDSLPLNAGSVNRREISPCGGTLFSIIDLGDLGLAPLAGDHFGSALAAGHFNDDEFLDLAIGAPGRAVASQASAGAVWVVYGDATGLDESGAVFFAQGVLEGVPEAGDLFGSVLAVGDFDANGIDDLAIGVIGESIGEIDDAGAVNIVYGQSAGLSALGNEILHQEVAGVQGDAQIDDRFGFALAAGDLDGNGVDDLAVGIPGESIDSKSNAGAVHVFQGFSTGGLSPLGGQFWHRSVPGVLEATAVDDEFGQTLAVGDFDGDGGDDLAIGVPGRAVLIAVPALQEVGEVHMLFSDGESGLTADEDQVLGTQLLGEENSYDRFGEALVAGDFDVDGFDDLAIAGRLENAAGQINVGRVKVMFGYAFGISLLGSLTVDATTAGNSLQAGEEFGFALAAGPLGHASAGDGLAIGAPGRQGPQGEVRSGMVYRSFRSFPFVDGFETGSTCAWSSVNPDPGGGGGEEPGKADR